MRTLYCNIRRPILWIPLGSLVTLLFVHCYANYATLSVNALRDSSWDFLSRAPYGAYYLYRFVTRDLITYADAIQVQLIDLMELNLLDYLNSAYLWYCVLCLRAFLHRTVVRTWYYMFPVCPPPQTLFFFFQASQSWRCEFINTIYEVPIETSLFDKSLVALIAFTITVISYLSSSFSIVNAMQELISMFLYHKSTSPLLRPETLRATFSSTPITKIKRTPAHTHPESAALRTEATNFIERFAPLVSLQPYFVQQSRADQRHGRKGSRAYYWSKDLNASYSAYDPPHDSLLALIDVDQYLDMPSLLSDEFKPVMLFTFQPSQVSRIAKNSEIDYSFTFNENNEVVYLVSGGGSYTHHVWNYATENVLVRKTFLGFPYKVASYGIDRRQIDLDHQLILLTPIRKWVGIFAFLSLFSLAGSNLARLCVVTGKHLRLLISSPEGVKISTGKVNEYAQGTVPADVDNTLATIQDTSKYDLTMAQAVSLSDGDKIAGPVLLSYHRNNSFEKPDVVAPVQMSMRVYEYLNPLKPLDYDPAHKPLMKPFMSPIIDECFVPTNCLSSEQVSVDKRVNAVKPPILEMTRFLNQCMQEFVEFLIPDPHLVDPYDDDYLFDQQNRPTQRRILETTPLVAKKVCNSFLKKESYQAIKDPRLISTINGTDKAAYSKFIYAFTDLIMKRQPWYAFGKSPIDIAARVVEVCCSAKLNAAKTDFTRFDGHGSNLMRELEQRCLVRAFRQNYTDEVLRLHRTQFGMKGYTTLGVEYDTEYVRLSGSPETATFNGLTNGFIGYYQSRLDFPDSPGLCPAAAWANLGIYGGDDGLTPDVHPKKYINAAKAMGQVIKVDPVSRGDAGVMFLARVYSPDVWNGDGNTCCDIPRQLSKLHVTVSLGNNVTPLKKLLEKCRSFWLTDEHTPLIGAFVSRAHLLLQSDFEANEETAAMRSWSANFPKDVQYPNEPADWMVDYCEEVLPNFNYRRFNEWINSCWTLTDLLSPPCCQEKSEPISTVPVAIDDEIYPLQTLPNIPPPPTTLPPPPPIVNPKPQPQKRKGKAHSADAKPPSTNRSDSSPIKAPREAAKKTPPRPRRTPVKDNDKEKDKGKTPVPAAKQAPVKA